MTSSAAIWGGALQASATLLVGGAGGERWGMDQPRGEYLAASPGQRAGAARQVVELAAQIIVELPDDAAAGISEAKEGARRRLEGRGR